MNIPVQQQSYWESDEGFSIGYVEEDNKNYLVSYEGLKIYN